MKSPVLAAASLLLVSSQSFAFGGFLQGVLENAVKDAATDMAKDTAKSVARQQGIQGADAMIDGAANVANNGGLQALQSGNPAITAQVAADVALANRQANTPIPAAQLRQFPPSLADLNGDGVVTWGEVQTVQKRNVGNVGFALRNTGGSAAPTHQPADLNRDGTVTPQEISAYRAAVAQVSGKAAPAAAPASNHSGSGLTSGLGGMLGSVGGLFGGGNSGTAASTDTDSTDF